jgi:hypothetical protein
MILKSALRVLATSLLSATIFAQAPAQTPAQTATQTAPATPGKEPVHHRPVSFNIYNRTRTDVYNWYSDPPYTSTYPFVEELLRVSVAQRLQHIDWLADVASATVFDVPTTALSPNAAQGAFGLGGNYYAASPNTTPSAVSFRQGWLRYDATVPGTNLRLGRYEFFDGLETTPTDPTLLWLQNNRVSQRLISNFGFTNGQRSFDGIDGQLSRGSWNITAMGSRATQGVFNMNANPELNVDVQYLAYSKYDLHNRFLWRTFAIDYHDGRTGVLKVDNRPLPLRQADHHNIRIGTYGADFITTIPDRHGEFDFVFWGVLQNGNWGTLTQHSGAYDIEDGYRFLHVRTQPWLRYADLRTTGDNNPTDGTHNTFFQILPTPRLYARFPFFDMMNSSEQSIQFIDDPIKHLELRSDLDFLRLTAANDLWYQGGGAYDNKVFGYAGRPSGGHNGLATLYDISSDYQLTHNFAVNLYYAHSFGHNAIATDYPARDTANFGYLELVYHWGLPQTPTPL